VQCAACLGLIAVLIGVCLRAFDPAEAAPVGKRWYQEPTTADLDVALRRLGITPEALAAVGASAGDVTTVIDTVRTALTNDPGLIAARDDAYLEAKSRADELRRLVESGQATANQVTQCQAAIAALAEAETDRAGMMDDLFAAVIAGLSEGERTLLTLIRANHRRPAPIEFLVMARSDADWLRLRESLANERISAKENETPDPADQAFLAVERARSGVSEARNNLDANLAIIQAAWSQAIAIE